MAVTNACDLINPEPDITDGDSLNDDCPVVRETSQNDDTDQAEAIRFQVHYYFSDENLAQDGFLLQKMHGHENKPIPIKTIHKLGSMQSFQPVEVVIEALKQSEILDIIQIGRKWLVKRKIAYSGAYPPGFQMKVSKSTKPSGFEEFYSDAPLTSAEHEEEQYFYSQDNSFAFRIETAIQKYQSKRRFSSIQGNIFIKFLKFGGITTGPRQFTGGMDPDFIESASSTEIAMAKATSFVDNDKAELGPDRKWDVDFEGIAKAFLSCVIPSIFAFTTREEVQKATNVLRNFYNYILYHQVCPEYTEDIFAARAICDVAEDELLRSMQLTSLLPGAYNKACSQLFNGLRLESMERFQAEYILVVAMAACGSYEDYVGEDPDEELTNAVIKSRIVDQTIIARENQGGIVGLEVEEIIYPDAEALETYRCYGRSPARGLDLKPIGVLICKPWDVDTFWILDTAESYSPPVRPDRYEFWIEEDILKLCFRGMKIEGVVAMLSGGGRILERVYSVHCSFYTISENELLFSSSWKEPEMYTREKIDALYAEKPSIEGEDEY